MSKTYIMQDDSICGIDREYKLDGLRITPTDNVRIDGKRYRLAKRTAEKGDMVVTTNRFKTQRQGTVTSVNDSTILIDGHYCYFHGDYSVLEPLEGKKSTDELLANIVRRLAQVERRLDELSEQIDSNTKDIRTIGEDHERTAFKVVDVEQDIGTINDKVEMIIDDIVSIDERTQCLTEQGIEQLAKDLVGLINERVHRI